MFDEEPDGDPHGECAAEIERLSMALRKANDQAEHFERHWYLAKEDADRWVFAAEHWCSLIGGIPLHRWLDAQKLRRGGLTAALDYAMNYHQNGERHIA